MVTIKELTEYNTEAAQRVHELSVQMLEGSKYEDQGECSREWFEEVIASPHHVLLLAYDDGRVVGTAMMSIVMGVDFYKNGYLESFVVDKEERGKGIAKLLWQAAVDWTRAHGAEKIEFTCNPKREAAQGFYKSRGAEVYETNFFQYNLK